MRKDVAARLNEVVKNLERDIAVLASCKFHLTVKLLRMARLDLLARIHGISDHELTAFAEALSKPAPTRRRTVVRASGQKRRRGAWAASAPISERP